MFKMAPGVDAFPNSAQDHDNYVKRHTPKPEERNGKKEKRPKKAGKSYLSRRNVIKPAKKLPCEVSCECCPWRSTARQPSTDVQKFKINEQGRGIKGGSWLIDVTELTLVYSRTRFAPGIARKRAARWTSRKSSNFSAGSTKGRTPSKRYSFSAASQNTTLNTDHPKRPAGPALLHTHFPWKTNTVRSARKLCATSCR